MSVLDEVHCERVRQDQRFKEQNHANGTGGEWLKFEADDARKACDARFEAGVGTWRDVLAEEVAEAFAESEPERLRADLLQIAAVAVAWVEALDRKATKAEVAAGVGT